MSKTIKVVESPREVYFAKTIEFTLLIEDKEISFRHFEDNNGAESFQLTDSGWSPINEEYNFIEDFIFNGFITEGTEAGEEFSEKDLEEYL
jgi:hypothetical protein